MKKLIFILLMLPLMAFALDLELSVGSTKFQRTDNTIWWQQGFENTFDGQSTSYSIGVSDYVWPSVRGRAAYTYLGSVYTYAKATTDDNYNGHGCINPCGTLDTIFTQGSIRGVSLTLAPEMRIAPDWKVFAEAGVFVFLPKFDAHMVKGGWYIYHKDGWQVGPQIGIGVEHKKMKLVLTGYKVDVRATDTQAIPSWQGWATNLSLRYEF